MPNCPNNECRMLSCDHCNTNVATVATGPWTSSGTGTVSFKDLEQMLIEEIARKHLH